MTYGSKPSSRITRFSEQSQLFFDRHVEHIFPPRRQKLTIRLSFRVITHFIRKRQQPIELGVFVEFENPELDFVFVDRSIVVTIVTNMTITEHGAKKRPELRRVTHFGG